MKPKQANTLQQKLGFLDDDLKKPLHDEIMLSLNSKIENIVNDIFYKPISDQEIEIIKDKANSIIKKFIADRNELIEYYSKQIKYYGDKDLSEWEVKRI